MRNRLFRAAFLTAGLLAAVGCGSSTKPSIPTDVNQTLPTTGPSTTGGGGAPKPPTNSAQ